MRLYRSLAVAACVAIAACSESPVENTSIKPSYARNGAQQSVTGHVERDLSAFGVDQEKYSFSAIRHPDGSVDGHFEVHDVYPDGSMDRVTGRVTCFTILADGKTARVAGVIESSTNALVPAGRDAVWVVRDNGEGNNDADDVATDLTWGYRAGSAAVHCASGLLTTTPPTFSLRGNVQVRP